jgi:hypothetical protein
LVFAAVLAVVAAWPFVAGGALRVWAIAAAGVFVALALAAPRLLAPLNKAWTKLGNALHRVVSPLALGIVFFGVVTPMGMAMRFMGKDPLRLRRDSAAPSYWIERDPPGPAPATFTDQF